MPIIDITYNEIVTIPANTNDFTDLLNVDGYKFATFTIEKTGADGNPIVSIYGSNYEDKGFDNVYVDENGNPESLTLTDVDNAIESLDFRFQHLKLKLDPNGTTTGDLLIKVYYE